MWFGGCQGWFASWCELARLGWAQWGGCHHCGAAPYLLPGSTTRATAVGSWAGSGVLGKGGRLHTELCLAFMAFTWCFPTNVNVYLISAVWILVCTLTSSGLPCTGSRVVLLQS